MKIEELYPGVERWEIPDKYYQNLVAFLPLVNALEEATGLVFKGTSGFRTWAIHKQIYANINLRRFAEGKSELPIPLHSKHLTGSALDIFDPKKILQKLLLDEKLLTDNNLWSEDFAGCPDWVHVQSVSYASWVPGGSRFFKP